MKKTNNIQLRAIPKITDLRQISAFESIVKKEAENEFQRQKEHGINKPYETIYSEWYNSLIFQWDFKKGRLKQ